MANYRKILLATDFSAVSGQLAEQAHTIAAAFGAELSLAHVLEPVTVFDPGYAEMFPLELELTDQMLEAAKTRLEQFAIPLAVPKARQWVELGSPKAEIVRIADENQIDLIVIGTHGRHGLGLLLGSTASSVVHHAHCDVLTVRLKEAA